jgi:hypothetical protein
MRNPDEKQWTFWDALLNTNPAWNEPDDEEDNEDSDNGDEPDE